MKKALLLTFLVFPGAGHFNLGEPRRGRVFILLSALALLIMIYETFHISLSILNAYPPEHIVALGVMQLSTLIEQRMTPLMSYSTLSLIVLWLLAVLDIIRIARSHKQN